MNTIHALSVFCGSSSGNDEAFIKEGFKLGQYMSQNNITLVYGGSRVGIMGAVADGAIAGKGNIIGVIPGFIKNKEIAHDGVTELIEVDSMHNRKMIMHQKSDGALILPGGFGTLDKMFELLTWGQLGLHQKPIGILNINGYFDSLIQFMDHMVNKNMLRVSNREMVLVSNDMEDLILQMTNYEAPLKPKWMEANQI
ncbi:MAG: TIGR00730 family Rossman fold protein [Chitinophagales bacterium]|nr:TIGR00730 family Rossman fold protein [Chitinophagales bacterium]